MWAVVECCLVHFLKHTSGCGLSTPLGHKLGFIRTLHHQAEKREHIKTQKIKKARRHQPRRNRTTDRVSLNVWAHPRPGNTFRQKKTGWAKEENSPPQAKEHLSWSSGLPWVAVFTPSRQGSAFCRLIIPDHSSLYLRPGRRTVPPWIVVLTSVSVVSS